MMRKQYGVLMQGNKPEGGCWNFDKNNRERFDGAPGAIKAPIHFQADDTTQGVLDLVEERLPYLCGSLDALDWLVTREEALRSDQKRYGGLCGASDGGTTG